MSEQHLKQGFPKTRTEEVLNPLIDILAYFAANKNYGYIDVLANALDPITAREALINALRDFEASCKKPQQAQGEVPCPSINPQALEKAVEHVESYLDKPGERLFSFTRSLALKALARASSFRRIQGGEG
ncbi:MAG: hypothetical protein GSR73_06155 [Desulfurococcales archaeon]|nr:hypothetical protein [Desulfurococcales archaeon]